MPATPDELTSLLARLAAPTTDPVDHAVDGTDRLLLAEAATLLPGLAPADVVVVDDRSGALTLGALALLPSALPTSGPVRVHQDWLTSRRTLEAAAGRLGVDDGWVSHDRLDAGLASGARLVLLRLPKSLDALTEVVETVARSAADDVVVLAAGPVKHMTRSMNDVLAASFTSVRASLGRHKARALVATGVLAQARGRTPTFPRTAHLDELGMDVVAHGGVFAGARLDIGTRFLLGFLDRMAPDARDAVDVGCGTGILATRLALARPGLRVVASDQSASAVASTAATAAANGVGGQTGPAEEPADDRGRAGGAAPAPRSTVTAVQDDALTSLPDASADLVVCNPPFHSGTALGTDAAHRMFREAGRVLRPGGELWTVYNSHLQYRRDLGRAVGPTEMMGQNPKFTVTRSVRRD